MCSPQLFGGAVPAGSWFATAMSVAMGGASVLDFAMAGEAIMGTTVVVGMAGRKAYSWYNQEPSKGQNNARRNDIYIETIFLFN